MRRAPDVRVLGPGIIARPLARGDDHRYQLALEAGEYVRIIVEQQGIDVRVEISDPAGERIAGFDDDIRPRGEERIDLVADGTGIYVIAIEPPAHDVAPGAYTIRIATRRPATEADRRADDSRRLRTAAAGLEDEGRFEEARAQLEDALIDVEAARGPDDVQVAAVAAQLAGVYRRLPNRPLSESLYRRAIATFDRVIGPDDPATAVVRSHLAVLYGDEGDHPKAEALLRQAQTVIEQTLGADDPRFIDCLITLGDVRGSAGDLDAEQAIIERGLSIAERIDATDSREYAALLNNLGEVLRQKGDYRRAEALFRRALALDERLLGAENYFVATPLQNLGIVARERKDYATAVAYNERALSIRQRVVGLEHPDVAHVLTNLANIYRATGDYANALNTHLRALAIWQNAAGPYNDATLLSVGNIAKTYAAAGDLANAIAYERWADAIVETQLRLNLAVGSERRKLTLVRSVSERTDRTLSLHLLQAPASREAASLAMFVLLQRKGRVQDAMTDLFAAARERVADREDRALLDRLNDVESRLAQLALKPPDGAPSEARRQALAGLEAQKEQLEARLTEHNAEFRARTQQVTVEAVQAALPATAALVEFAVFRPFDPAAERNTDAYGAPRYAAYVLRRTTAPIGFDLGDAAAIDHAIESFRNALRNPSSTDVAARARAVDERVMGPLRSALGKAARLIISPDGELNLIPFEALADEHGRYLIDRFTTSYVSSGRDLLRNRIPRGEPTRPVIVADPFFGEPAADVGVRPVAFRSGPRSTVTTGSDLSAVYFAPLAATVTEARAIQSLVPDAILLRGRHATKSSLQRLKAPQFLHIASHGFFLSDRDDRGPGTDANPLLRSGLALAGANRTGGGRADGILTALEASSLDLWGTKLVTLSACDTGVGEIRNGEGVYGLRRAFVLAGAETLVMSLWPVTDFVARSTMVAYYAGLRAGLGRGDALREAKRAMRRRRPHPYFWAGFIQSGEWARLDGTRPDDARRP